jgi:hypothetical protein
MSLRANEESYAKFLFQLFDLHAKRRLSDMQRSTRLAEIQIVGMSAGVKIGHRTPRERCFAAE